MFLTVSFLLQKGQKITKDYKKLKIIIWHQQKINKQTNKHVIAENIANKNTNLVMPSTCDNFISRHKLHIGDPDRHT